MNTTVIGTIHVVCGVGARPGPLGACPGIQHSFRPSGFLKEVKYFPSLSTPALPTPPAQLDDTAGPWRRAWYSSAPLPFGARQGRTGWPWPPPHGLVSIPGGLDILFLCLLVRRAVPG